MSPLLKDLLKHRFMILVIAMACLFLIYPLLHDFVPRAVYVTLRGFMVLAAFLAIFRRLRWPIITAGLAMVAMAWIARVMMGGNHFLANIIFHATGIAFLSAILALMLSDILRTMSVTREHIFAAISVYLLIGVVFGHIYSLIDIAYPNAFLCQNQILDPNDDDIRRYFLLTYFSMSTLTTVSYGDITPGADGVRGLAMMEAVMGQFYIAVLIAILVNRSLAGARASDEGESAIDRK